MSLPVEILVELPASLGIARTHAPTAEVVTLVDTAVSVGITAAIERLQQDGGYVHSGRTYRRAALTTRTQLHRPIPAGQKMETLHVHLMVDPVSADTGEPVHQPAVARAAAGAQMAAVRAAIGHMEQAGVQATRTRATAAGHELAAFVQAAAALPRQSCPPLEPVTTQVAPLDRWATHSARSA